MARWRPEYRIGIMELWRTLEAAPLLDGREGHSGVHRVSDLKAGKGMRTVHGRCEEHVP